METQNQGNRLLELIKKEAQFKGDHTRSFGKKEPEMSIVDDEATSGGSPVKGIDAVEKEGCNVVNVLCLVGRNEGASSELAKRGYALNSLYRLKDLGV